MCQDLLLTTCRVVAVFKGTNILLIVVILCLAYPHANPQNITDFFPYKDHGVFAGVRLLYLIALGGSIALQSSVPDDVGAPFFTQAAVVFFAYNGCGRTILPFT